MVIDFGDNAQVECVYNRIGPEPTSHVLSKEQVKKYRVVNNKGLISSNFTLYPFGFK